MVITRKMQLKHIEKYFEHFSASTINLFIRDKAKFIFKAMKLDEFNGNPSTVRTQSKINLEFEEISLPIIGYIDLELETTLRELKSVRAIPSAIPHAVQRQASIYSYATKKPIWVDYISKKNCTSYKVTNVEDNIKEVIQICQSIEKFLSISEDIHEIAGMFYPNLDSWEWDKNDINTAKKIWSIK